METMTKEKQDKLKHHLIHTIMVWVEENGCTKNEAADVLCSLSHDLRDGDGNIFYKDDE